jgi:DNA mismatch repair protein MutL
LFYNLPARRKFLRSEETERAHSQHYLTLAALAHPQVGFTFVNEQRLVWQLPPQPAGGDRWASVQERLCALLGPDLRLLAVDHTVELADATEPVRRQQPSASGDSSGCRACRAPRARTSICS